MRCNVSNTAASLLLLSLVNRSTDTTLSVFALSFTNATIDLGAPGPLSEVLNLRAPLPPLPPPLPPSLAAASIAGVTLFSEQSLLRPPLDPSLAGLTVGVQPSAVWAAVVVLLEDGNSSSSSSSSVLLLRLPQFSDPINVTEGGQEVYPPAVPPTMGNPAGVSPASQACGWNRFWDGNACQWVPIASAYSGSGLPAASLEVRVERGGRGVRLCTLALGAGAVARHAAGPCAASDFVGLPLLERVLPRRVDRAHCHCRGRRGWY